MASKPTPSPSTQWNTPQKESIEDFLSFIGLKYGDDYSKAIQLFGTPTRIEEDGLTTSTTLHYFPDNDGLDGGLKIIHHQDYPSISMICVDSKYAIQQITGRGIEDDKLKCFGMHWSEIKKKYGNDFMEFTGSYTYDDFINKLRVTFICYSWRDYKCCLLMVQWELF